MKMLKFPWGLKKYIYIYRQSLSCFGEKEKKESLTDF